VQRRGAESRRVVAGWIGSQERRDRRDENTLARGEVEISVSCGDRRIENQLVRGRPRGLIEPDVLVAARVAGRRQLGGSVVGLEGTEMLVSLLIVMMRQRVRQHRGRGSGPDEDSQSKGEQTPVAQAPHATNV